MTGRRWCREDSGADPVDDLNAMRYMTERVGHDVIHQLSTFDNEEARSSLQHVLENAKTDTQVIIANLSEYKFDRGMIAALERLEY
jgi:hypothetical protein